MNAQHSIDFFERQFRGQVEQQDLALNPFERIALEHLAGRVLDHGCGLGNLSVQAARRGLPVLALDASPTAIAHLQDVALRERLPLQARQADLSRYRIEGEWDTVVSIGLLMFFDCPTARRVLGELQAHVAAAGTAIVNVLIEGTTFMDMFDQAEHCLFGADELRTAFAGWHIVSYRIDEFPAPGERVKRFATIVARKASGPSATPC
jgi:tellurite methyltransferase